MKQPLLSRAAILRFALVLPVMVAAHASDDDLMQALTATSPIIDLRLRHEEVEQTGLADNADANTLRARLGLKTGDFLDTSILLEGVFMGRLDRSYRPDNALPTYAQFPVVADPPNVAFNRFELINKSLPSTTITLGRQVIVLDDQRFVGNSAWRQNEVTFDAVRLVNQSIPNLTLDLTALDKVNRIYGHDSPQGTYTGTSYLANAGYHLPVGTVTAFAYLLDFNPITGLSGALDPRRGSTSTVGGRLAGNWPVSVVKLGYTVSYASQKPRGDNPLIFKDDYLMGEVRAEVARFALAAGVEILHGNGIAGFATPLATLHLFQGWADKFLTTPTDGIDDRYVSLGWTKQKLWYLDSLTASVVYHDFAAQSLSVDYGKESDAVITGKWHHYAGTLKYAAYGSAQATPVTLARDTEKFWAQIEYVW